MSWLFSQALVEEYSQENCLDGGQYAQLNVMPTPHGFSHNDKMMDVLSLFLFGLTFAVLTDDRGEELLTSFLADFRARTSAQQEKAQASTANDLVSGLKWHASLAKYDHNLRSWKTHQYSILGCLDEYSETWPRWGLMRDGECWEQPTLAHRIKETGSGLLPTITALNYGYQRSFGGKPRPSLTTMARKNLWPTITVHGNYNKKGLSKASGDGLATAVRKAIYPTPLDRDWRSGKTSQKTRWKNSRPLSEKIGGSLNPTWVEWFMGWPINWTSLEQMNHEYFRNWQKKSTESVSDSGKRPLRSLWWDEDPSETPYRPQSEISQRKSETISRTAVGIKNSVDRIKCLGNGQVPQCAAEAWLILLGSVL